MNFLAHIALSGDDDDLLAGNFMGDFVKASKWKLYPQRIAEGVLLHRAIDAFTDDHPLSFELRRSLHPACGKYAPIALDMLYDHMLAAEFQRWFSEPLNQFAKRAYLRLKSREEHFPERCKFMFGYMVRQDWLTSYARFEGIDLAMQRMERRIGKPVGLQDAAKVFVNDSGRFFNVFYRIFPEIQRMCSDKLVSFARCGKDE